MIKVRHFHVSDKACWDDYVENHPDATVFHLTAWKEVIENAFGCRSLYLLAVEDSASRPAAVNYGRVGAACGLSDTGALEGTARSKIKGLLPIFRIKNILFGDYLVSLPFAEVGGVLANNEEIKKKLLNRAVLLVRDKGSEYIELRHRKPEFELPVKSLYVSFKREIFSDLEQNLKAIPRKSRRMVRQGLKKGLTSETGHHLLPEFYQIFAKSYHRLGTPVFSKRLFQNFIRHFGSKAQFMIVRTANGRPIAGVLTFFFKNQVIPYYAGSLFEFRNLAPNDFMYWELMRYGWESGYRIFDFGRSKKDTGSYHFKRHWGFEPIELSYQYYLNKAHEIPNLSPANPKFRKKIALWKKLPFAATKIFGPPIARYLT